MLLGIFFSFESVSMLLHVEHILVLSKCYCGHVQAKITGVCACNMILFEKLRTRPLASFN